MTDPVWSVIILLSIGVIGVSLYILNILVKVSAENVSIQNKKH
jgi:hypothetical protein